MSSQQLLAIEKYFACENIVLMKREDIANLPKWFLLKVAFRDIDVVWDKLPLEITHDKDIQKFRRCRHRFTGRVQIDGPPPFSKNCSSCLAEMV